MSARAALTVDRGPVLAVLAVFAGARAGESFDLRLLVVAGAVATAALGWASSRGGGRRWAIAGLATLALLAAGSMQRALAGLDNTAARLAARAGGAEVVARVRLTGDPRAGPAGLRVTGRLEAVRSRRRTGAVAGSVLVAARGDTAGRLRLLEAGESAVLAGRLRLPAGWERVWRWRHVAAVLDATDVLAAGPVRSPLLRLANGLRHLVLRGSDRLPATERALVGGFLVGDERGLPPRVLADFRAAGLSHLLVVSGANVALALTLARPALRRLGLAGRMAGGVAVLVVFAAMTRFEPSVLRATAMSGLALLGAFLGRPAGGLRLLALAVTGLVLGDPFLVHSVGFGLSCGASAGIVLLAGPLATRLPGPAFARESLAVTAAAQVGVAPVALPAFGSLPLAALPANLVAAPAAAALTLWGLGSGVVGGLAERVWPWGAGLLQLPTAALALYLEAVARIAALRPVPIRADRSVALALIVVLAGVALIALAAGWRRRRKGLGQVPTRVSGLLPASRSRPKR